MIGKKSSINIFPKSIWKRISKDSEFLIHYEIC